MNGVSRPYKITVKIKPCVDFNLYVLFIYNGKTKDSELNGCKYFPVLNVNAIFICYYRSHIKYYHNIHLHLQCIQRCSLQLMQLTELR